MMEVMHYHNIVEDDDVVVNCRTSLPPRNLQNSFSALLENDDEDDLNVNTSILLNDFNETKEPIFSPQPLSPSHSSEVLLGSLFASNEKEKTIFQKPIPEEDGEIEIKEHLLQNNFINIITEQNTKITQVPVKETKQEIHTDNNSELDFPELRGKCRVLEKIGEGTFSSVFKGICLKTNRIVALKRICPTCSPERILNEMKHLHLLGGKCKVPKLLGGYRLHDQITLSMPYIEHDKFKDFLPTMTVSQIREYMRALFEALEHLHANKVIHRDVKPGNFLYHIKSNTFMLVDFGLAQTEQEIFAQADDSTIEPERTKSTTGPVKRKRSDGMDQYGSPGKRAKYPGVSPGLIRRSSITGETPNAKNSLKAPRGGTRGFRAPEVLLKYQKQSFSIDIWSAGVVLLCILSTRYPFFTAPDDLVSLAEIGALFGTKELKQAALLIQRKVTFPWDPVEIPKSSLKDVCNRLTSRSYQMPDSVFDLLNACLDLNPHTRITASEALKHPFFA